MPVNDRLEQVIPEGLVVKADVREILLEIAYLAIAADRRLDEEEIDGFGLITSRLLGREATAEEVETLLNRFADELDRSQADERLRLLAAKLPDPKLRELAYKVAYGLSVCDLDTSDEEFEFDLQLIDSLELTQDTSERLQAEVIELLGAE